MNKRRGSYTVLVILRKYQYTLSAPIKNLQVLGYWGGFLSSDRFDWVVNSSATGFCSIIRSSAQHLLSAEAHETFTILPVSIFQYYISLGQV